MGQLGLGYPYDRIVSLCSPHQEPGQTLMGQSGRGGSTRGRGLDVHSPQIIIMLINILERQELTWMFEKFGITSPVEQSCPKARHKSG